MTIITKPSAIDKGIENVITLNKADLASDTKVVADSYYSDQNNWKNVYITYKTPEGGQVNDVIFDASEASPVGSFNPTLKARDTWEVQSVTIQDFDNGSLKLLRGDLTVAEFDIVFGAMGYLFSDTLKHPTDVIISNNNLTSLVSGDNHKRSYIAPPVSAASGKYYLELNADATNTGGPFIGLSQLLVDPTAFESTFVGDPNGGNGAMCSGSGSCVGLTGGSQTSAYSSLAWFTTGAKVTIAFDLDDPIDVKFWIGVDGDYGVGNDPIAGTGGATFPKDAGSNIYISIVNNITGSIQMTIEETPVNVLAGYDYLGLV